MQPGLPLAAGRFVCAPTGPTHLSKHPPFVHDELKVCITPTFCPANTSFETIATLGLLLGPWSATLGAAL